MVKIEKKVLFIINPLAGRRKKEDIPKIIESVLGNSIKYKIVFWEAPNQNLSDIIHENTDRETNIIASVGGDGTFNSIASNLIDTDKTILLIPIGSGNGIARHLRIPMNLESAIKLVQSGKTISIDACRINDKFFFTIAGVGFDAHISQLFEQSDKRGFGTYFYKSMTTFFKYKTKKFTLVIDGNKSNENAFIISFANANQYGNNAIIAPKADIQDGMIDTVIMQKPNLFRALFILYRLFNSTIDKSSIVKYIQGKKIILTPENITAVHYDGENMEEQSKLEISILPGALKVIVPQIFN